MPNRYRSLSLLPTKPPYVRVSHGQKYRNSFSIFVFGFAVNFLLPQPDRISGNLGISSVIHPKITQGKELHFEPVDRRNRHRNPRGSYMQYCPGNSWDLGGSWKRFGLFQQDERLQSCFSRRLVL